MGKSKQRKRNKSVIASEQSAGTAVNSAETAISGNNEQVAAQQSTDQTAVSTVGNAASAEEQQQPLVTFNTDIQPNGTVSTTLLTEHYSTDVVTHKEITDSSRQHDDTVTTSAAKPVAVAQPVAQSHRHAAPTANLSGYFSNVVNIFGESSSRISSSLLNGITSITDTTQRMVQHNDDTDRRLSSYLSKRISPHATVTESPVQSSKPPLSTSSAVKSPVVHTAPVEPKLKPPQHRTMRFATITEQPLQRNGSKHSNNKQYIDTAAYVPNILLQAEQALQSQRNTLSSTPHSVPLHRLSASSYSAPNTVEQKRQSSCVTELDTAAAQLQAHALFTAK